MFWVVYFRETMFPPIFIWPSYQMVWFVFKHTVLSHGINNKIVSQSFYTYPDVPGKSFVTSKLKDHIIFIQLFYKMSCSWYLYYILAIKGLLILQLPFPKDILLLITFLLPCFHSHKAHNLKKSKSLLILFALNPITFFLITFSLKCGYG